MSPVPPARAVTASLSDVGRVRSVNEDCCGEFSDEGGRRLLVVADGMGGHRGGATASRHAVEIIGKHFQAEGGEPETLLRAAIGLANQRLFELSQSNPELRGMGTTVVSLLLDVDGRATVAHVGDSRAYQLRGRNMRRLTEDHSVVGEMVRKGVLSDTEAAYHPRRNEILRSVGVAADVEVDVVQVDVQVGDRLLLCSDGLCGLLADDELAVFLSRAEPNDAVRMLVDEANARGGPDNITAQIAAIPEEQSQSDYGSEITATMSAGQVQDALGPDAFRRGGEPPAWWSWGGWLGAAAVVAVVLATWLWWSRAPG